MGKGAEVRTITWASEKGGTGKSTAAINSAVALARTGKRVLLVDLDPQANSSLVFTRGQGGDPPTTAEVLLGDVATVEAIRPTDVERLDLLPASVALADAALALTNAIGREARLRAALDGLDYDIVVIDTPPTRSLLTVNALVAADEVLIPVEPSLFSLAGLGALQSAVADVRRYLGNDRLRIGGILLSRTRNDNVSRDVEKQLRESLGSLVFETVIPSSIRIEEAHGRFQSVLDYAPRSPGALAFEALGREILSHVANETGGAGGTAERDLPKDRARQPRRAAG